MAIVCVKIGENEPDTYSSFDRMLKHLDIIDVRPTNDSLGTKADKHFFILNVDMSHLDKTEFSELRGRLSQEWTDHARRLYHMDLAYATFLSTETKSKILVQTSTKRSIKPAVYAFVTDYEELFGEKPPREEVAAYKEKLEEGFDMMTVNKFGVVVPFSTFAAIVINKNTGQTLAEELK